jgi:ABC-2 type transport system permease protein
MLVVWFVLGFAFYATLYGSLGSLASRSEDAQAAAGPVIAVVAGTYVLAIMAMTNPAAGWVTIVSMLPPTAPIIMPLRAALVSVPPWQMAAAVILLLAAIYLLLRAGARLYRNAVLHTGARLRLRQAWRGEPAQAQPAQH